jgi:methionyl aminopeptidase
VSKKVLLKRPHEIAAMRAAGHIVAKILVEMEKVVAPGVRTSELDALAAELLRQHGATSSFFRYPHHENGPPFPAHICVCLNDELVHGIPNPKRVLRDGDIVSVDVGAVVDGWIADAAWTFPVGAVSPRIKELLDVTREALYRGIAASKAGNRIGDVGWTIESFARQYDFAVIRKYVGHGVGRQMHEEPSVPNHGPAGQGLKLREGMTYAIEPLLTLGRDETRELKDGWTIVMEDHSWCAQFEHTIAVHNGSAEILTAL